MPTFPPVDPLAALHRQLARFRYRLRVFLRFSENAARAAGVSPLQHQLMLGVAGYTGRGSATVSELSEYLQHRHNAVVALVTRAQQAGLVTKRRDRVDRRVVNVQLTARGLRILAGLSRLHHGELRRFEHDFAAITAARRSTRRRSTAARRKRR